MVIDSNNISSTSGSARGRSSAPVANPKPTPATQDSAVAQAAEHADNVVISKSAQGLARLQAAIATSPDVDLNRVAALRLAIEQGRFEINADKIAENMLKQDELLS